MEKDKFMNEIISEIDNISLPEAKKIIIELCNNISEGIYYKILYFIKNIGNNLTISLEEIEQYSNEIYGKFKKVESGDIVFKCYSIETGYYSAFGEEYDYYFYPTSEMNVLLNDAYNFAIRLIFTKNYNAAINIFDLILKTNYVCEEISNPEYSDFDEVIDTFDIDIYSVSDNLDFNLNNIRLYIIYAIIMTDDENKYKKIDEYISGSNIDIRDCQSYGIEKIDNFDKIYDGWLEYKNIDFKI